MANRNELLGLKLEWMRQFYGNEWYTAYRYSTEWHHFIDHNWHVVQTLEEDGPVLDFLVRCKR